MKRTRLRYIIGGLVFCLMVLAAGIGIEIKYTGNAKTELLKTLQYETRQLQNGLRLTAQSKLEVHSNLTYSDLNKPASGLYAIIVNDRGETLWASPSHIDVAYPETQSLPVDKTQLSEVISKDIYYQRYSQGILLTHDSGAQLHVTVNVFSEAYTYYKEVRYIRLILANLISGVVVLALLIGLIAYRIRKSGRLSLRARLLIFTGLFYFVVMLAIGIILDRIFYQNAMQNLQDNLSGATDVLMLNTNLTEKRSLEMRSNILNSDFSLPTSELYGVIVDEHNTILWKSLNTAGLELQGYLTLPTNTKQLHKITIGKEHFYLYATGIKIFAESSADISLPVTLNVIIFPRDLNEQIFTFRMTLTSILLGIIVILLFIQWIILSWGLRPLNAIGMELRAIDAGNQENINGIYPSEIQPLTANINELIEHKHAQQTRYRNALADLAHSLKTPLAVLRGAVSEIPDHDNRKVTLDEQIQRMDHIVAYQLQRAATSGIAPIQRSIELEPLVNKLVSALQKVYRDKQVRITADIPPAMRVRVDAGDAMEVLGNMLDNASKWCHQQVHVSAVLKGDRIEFCIADDGPGVAEDKRQHILQRGGRLDEAVPGQGIGLAVANDIIHAYQGTLRVEHSKLGGAAFCFDFPA